MIKLYISASLSNLVIGKDDEIPWDLPTNNKHLKDIISGNKVIMGRKTWEYYKGKIDFSQVKKIYVLSRDINFTDKDVIVINKVHDIIENYKSNKEQLIVLGGVEVFEQFFKYGDMLYITHIYTTIEGNRLLEGLAFSEWYWWESSGIIEEDNIRFNMEVYYRK